MQGMGKIMDAEFANRSEKRWLCRLFPKLTFFFDGTGNNLYQELEKPAETRALSNVAKLYRAAIGDPAGRGAKPTYIPGVGTPFRIPRVPGYTELLRNDHGGAAGLGLGAGGDVRIDYAINEFARILEQDWSEGALRHMPYVSLAVFGFSRGATEARAFVRRLTTMVRRRLLPPSELSGGWVQGPYLLSSMNELFPARLARAKSRALECRLPPP